MTDMPKYYGLCETCDHDATCNLRRFPQLTIIQCEEFSTQAGAPVRDLAIHSDRIQASCIGLCVNCRNSLTCGFPNARQNVLYCEEYILDEAGIIPPVQEERSRSAA
jgi:hypothetical protein